MVVSIYGALSTWWMTPVEDRQCPQGGSWRRTGETVGPEVCVLRPVPSDLKEETEAGQVRVVLMEERRLLMVSVHQEVLVSSFIHGHGNRGIRGQLCVQSCVSFSVEPRILVCLPICVPASWRTGWFLHCHVPIARVKHVHSVSGQVSKGEQTHSHYQSFGTEERRSPHLPPLSGQSLGNVCLFYYLSIHLSYLFSYRLFILKL